MIEFDRDRLTWVAYVVLAWFALLQAAPGLVLPYLLDELRLSYSVGGLHVAAFAAGSMAAGLLSGRLERALGRRVLLWAGAALMGAGVVVLTAGSAAEVTISAILVMGLGGGFVLVAVQALLSDRHHERRAVALTEANVAASIGYLLMAVAISVTAALNAGWRLPLLASLTVPLFAWWSSRRLLIEGPPPASRAAGGHLPGVVWIAAGMLFCTTAAEWSVIAWGASFVETNAGVSAGTAVALMAGYFGGVLAGRAVGSRLARAHEASRLLAVSLAVAAVGFAVFWPSTTPAQASIGLGLLGIGLGNLYPLGTSVTIALAPGRAASASGRVVAMTAFAGLVAPLVVGPLADATSLSAALLVVPGLLAAAATALALVVRGRAGTMWAGGRQG